VAVVKLSTIRDHENVGGSAFLAAVSFLQPCAFATPLHESRWLIAANFRKLRIFCEFEHPCFCDERNRFVTTIGARTRAGESARITARTCFARKRLVYRSPGRGIGDGASV